MARVLVLLGGKSSEREVSLRSGQAVVAALQAAGHSVATYDPANGDVSIADRAADFDTVFPVLHGAGGEDGSLQESLEAHMLRFVGSGSATSRLCFDKWQYKQFLAEHSVPTPYGELVDKKSFTTHKLTKHPYVLKPSSGGSSIDTFIVRDPSHADLAAIKEALERYGRMLIEGLVPGTEITVAALDDQALPVIEIIPPADQEFDYENKYNGATQELCPPEHVDRQTQAAAQELARFIHTQAGCQGMSRTDMIVDPNNKLWVLETNTIPGMTEQSLLPKAAAAASISMPALVDRLVQSAIKV